MHQLRRGLFVAPLIAVVLSVVVACSSSSDSTVVGTATEATTPVTETSAAPDSQSPETTVVSGTATFSMVAAVTGNWPNPVPKEQLAITDIDNEKLCALLFDGGAFSPVTGEYYEGKMSRVGEELQFTCKYQRDAASPVGLDGFAEAFVAALAGTVEPPTTDEQTSLGRVTFTLDDDPLASVGSDELFRAGGRGCAAAATAAGLPAGWTLETVGSFDDKPRVVCRGPVATPEIIEVDPSAVATIVGDALPPKD